MSRAEFNVTKMFENLEPWDCSNSAANLGQNAGQITWRNALEVAEHHRAWTKDVAGCVDFIKEWAADTGTWDDEEIESWGTVESLGLLVQNVASDMRMLGSDDHSLMKCAAKYRMTNWDRESDYPKGRYWATGRTVMGEMSE